MLRLIKEEIEEVEEVNIPEETELSDVPADIVNNAFTGQIRDLINTAWDFISSINSVIATLDYEYKNDNKEQIESILDNVVSDLTVDIGMLNKASSMISQDQEELLDQGAEKAEEIITK